MKKKSVLSIVFVFVLLFSIRASAETEIYAHISYLDNEAFVIRAGEDNPVKAVLNLPLLTGDTVFTKDKGRCEIQFGNGTIIRLDKETSLEISTVLAKGLTTHKKITTLKLEKGHIYSMNQVYKGEIFQVVTDTAAVKMIKRSTNSIRVDEKAGTHVYVVRGRVGVLYGDLNKTPKKVFINNGKGLLITNKSTMNEDNNKNNKEFYLWNRMVNKNFKDLHYGKSKVPDVIYRRSPGIVHFAERFSTKYGTWVYNDIFGYVWQPADEIFKDRRPFFDANFVKINGELVLVPNRPWGWAPAHLGSWFWSKAQGWVWIPGDVLTKGICSVGLKCTPELWDETDTLHRTSPYFCCCCNLLNDWIDCIYGDIGLYGIYRTHGKSAWEKAYKAKFHKKPTNLKLAAKITPAHLKSALEKIDSVAFEKLAVEMNRGERASDLTVSKIKIMRVVTPGNEEKMQKTSIYASRDWNPDARWAVRTGVKIFYSAKKDAIICPELKLSSKEITGRQRTLIKRSVTKQSVRNLVYNNTAGTNYKNNTGSTAVSGRNNKTRETATGTVSTANKAEKK